MHNIIKKQIGILLSIYIMAIIVFKQNYNTYTYYIDILFFISVIIYYIFYKKTDIVINGLLYSYFFFIVVSLASSIYGIDFSTSSFKVLQLFIFFINMLVIYNVLTQLNLYIYFMNGILLASFVNYVLLLGLADAPFDIVQGYRAMGTTGNANVLAGVMLLSIFTSILYLQRLKNTYLIYYHYINIPLALYIITITVSKKGIIFGSLLIIIYLFILLLHDKKTLFRLASVVLALSAIIVMNVDMNEITDIINNVVYRFSAFQTQMSGHANGGSTYERKYLIEQAWYVFQDNPLFGHGMGTFSQLNKFHLYAHNNYMELLANVGLVGSLAYYSMYYFLIKNIYRLKAINMKVLFSLIIIIFLFMDIALVSYGSKYLLYYLVFLIAYLESLRTSWKGEFFEKN